MKQWLISIVFVLFMAAGCTDALLVGGGVAAGGALSNTLQGAEKDLEAREQKLIEAYNQGVEQGASVETLDQLEQAIYDTRQARKTTSGGKRLLDIDWNDPTQVGTGITLIGTLAYGWLKRKELAKGMKDLTRTKKKNEGLEAGINKFCGTHDKQVAGELHDTVKEKTNAVLAS